MTRSEFIAAAAVGLTGVALSKRSEAELLIAKVTPSSVAEMGFTVNVARGESGLIRFDITRAAPRSSRDEVWLRLAIGGEDAPIVVCNVEPKRVEIKGDPVFRYRFDLGEKHLAETTLDCHEGGQKQLGGSVYQFDLKAFVAAPKP
jgi:hypothetical protein